MTFAHDCELQVRDTGVPDLDFAVAGERLVSRHRVSLSAAGLSRKSTADDELPAQDAGQAKLDSISYQNLREFAPIRHIRRLWCNPHTPTQGRFIAAF
jgi:hypothetical protein